MGFQGEYFVRRFGRAAARATPPVLAMLRAGIPVGAGTDGTRVASYHPWTCLQWLVTGKTVGGTELTEPSERLTREEALRLPGTDADLSSTRQGVAWAALGGAPSHSLAHNALLPGSVEHALVLPRVSAHRPRRVFVHWIWISVSTKRASASAQHGLAHRRERAQRIGRVDPELRHGGVAALDVARGREARERDATLLVEAGARARDDVVGLRIRLHLPVVFALGERYPLRRTGLFRGIECSQVGIGNLAGARAERTCCVPWIRSATGSGEGQMSGQHAFERSRIRCPEERHGPRR
jgi:hypothetical protein